MAQDKETERQRVLKALGLLDTEPEEKYDRFTELAKKHFDVPISLISLIDKDRQWFKSRQGLNVSETPRDQAFCAHTIMDDQIFIVHDAKEDERFRDNPLVTGSPNIRYYAGSPLFSNDGVAVGTLCIIDTAARDIPTEELKILRILADCVEQEMFSGQHHKELEDDKLAKGIWDFARVSADRFWEMDDQFRYIWFFDYSHSSLEPRTHGLIGKTRWEVINADPDTDEHWRAHREMLQNHLEFEGFEYSVSDESGLTSWWSVSGVPVFDENGKFNGYRGVGRSITEEKLLELEREKAVKAAQDANTAKTEFFASVSHELRTPLNAIIGFSQLLSNGVVKNLTPEKVEGYARNIGEAGRTLLHLINDLLDLASLESRQFELEQSPFLVAEEIDNITSLFAVQAKEKNINFIVNTVKERVAVRGDAMRMRQVLFNLLSNALKFAAGGTVKIETRLSFIDKDQLKLAVIVEDDGIGIADDRIEAIFSPFSQSDTSINRQYGGTGLGLPISRTLARLMGGDVVVDSEVGKGSTFTASFVFEDLTGLDLKFSTENAGTGPEHQAELGLTVLGVDDIASNREVLASLLEDLGCRMVSAKDGEEAIALLEREKVDAILLDLHMPKMDGIACAKSIQAQEAYKNIPIFAWTADVSGHHLMEQSDIRWAGKIIKPTSRDALLLALRRVKSVTSVL